MIRKLFSLYSAFTFFFSHDSFANDARPWEEYYQNTLNFTDPHKTLLLAHKYFQLENITTGKAADLGAGTGRDTLYLLKSGWQVFALDAEQLSIDIILNRVDPQHLTNLQVIRSTFEEMRLPADLDLINASFSLPFCKPPDFGRCWDEITGSLSVGGRFCGQFFGEHDAWASNPNLMIHSYEALKGLFQRQFIIEYLQIEDGMIPSANGTLKHWHVYHVVAKKINSQASD